MELQVVRLGCMPYVEVLKIQEALQHQVMNHEHKDVLLLLDHPPVITKGIRGEDENILLSPEQLKDLGVDIIECKRGGDVTYLGPGQVIGYPIMNLKRHGKDVHEFVTKIEQIIVQIMKEDYHTETIVGSKKYTGVFVGDDKIAAIGIAVSRWVTMHGFAFNVNTDLSHFKWIIPCGLKDKGVTSVQKITGHKMDIRAIEDRIIEKFEASFNVTCHEITKEELIKNLTERMKHQHQDLKTSVQESKMQSALGIVQA